MALPSSASIDLVSSGLPLGLHQGFASLALGSRGPESNGHSPASFSHAPPPPPTHLPPHQTHDLQYHAQSQSQPQQNSSKRRAGVCKSLKGFGFVVDQRSEELGGQEVFCHFSAISGKGGFRSLAEVEYDLVQGPKGFQASNLTGPGGRSVVGDPKARLTKPQTFMPFAPLSMPLSPPYISDPYQQQHPGVYAASPYTQHVLYVPSSIHNATISLPSSQYGYTAIQHPGQSRGSPGGNGPFPGQGYPTPSFGSTGFQSMGGQGPYQQHSHLNQRNPSAIAPSGYNGEKGGFGAYANQSMNGGGAPSSHGHGNGNGHSHGHGNGNGNMGIGAMAFAPFNSPPAFSNPALFSPPATFSPASPPSPPYSLPARTSSTSSGGPSLTNGGPGAVPATGAGGFGSNGSAILFGSNPSAGAVGTPRSNASAGGTTPREERREERRGTPLGNGTITAGSNVFGPPVLYTSGDASTFA
ncbi:hypothetical protein RQP46_000472 [Phenoliferia psychrophenolica]